MKYIKMLYYVYNISTFKMSDIHDIVNVVGTSDDINIARVPKQHLAKGVWTKDFEKRPFYQYRFTYKEYKCSICRGGFGYGVDI